LKKLKKRGKTQKKCEKSLEKAQKALEKTHLYFNGGPMFQLTTGHYKQ
jgi:hypothetical protein